MYECRVDYKCGTLVLADLHDLPQLLQHPPNSNTTTQREKEGNEVVLLIEDC